MRFLLHGNSPTAKTGYGVQIGYLADCLKAAGHEVAISNTYGVQGAISQWHGIRVYPQGYDVNSNDIIHGHADHFFQGEEGWVITLIDVWAMVTPRLRDYNVAAWCPIDHFPVQPGVLQFFSESEAVPIAMSQWGHELFQDKGVDAAYVPLSVDTTVFKPTPTLPMNGQDVPVREVLGDGKITDDAFVVGMVAMNKGWARDRKGFNEAFWAMGAFMRDHDDVVLYMHTERWGGAEGVNLVNLAVHAGIPEHRLIWAGGPDQYAYRVGGFTPEMMAGTYSMFDVLLAPSHGEGFCVPLIEAQACGCPVIATDFSAQRELANPDTGAAGWLVHGQPEWDPAHHAAYVNPSIVGIVDALESAYAMKSASDQERAAIQERAISFAAKYDVQRVFQEYWVPFIESLEAPATALSVPREPMPEEHAVAVLCPVLNRPENVAPLVESFIENTPEGEAKLYFIYEDDDIEERAAVWASEALDLVGTISAEGHTFAEKLNVGYENTTEPWVLCIGDDVRFHEGWLDQARKLSSEFDVIGTNDSLPGRIRNPKVARGAHSDHTFFRRAYVEEHGGCLDGPGVLAPEVYRHWYTDREMIDLARARGVFTPCLDSIVEHLHPGYDATSIEERLKINEDDPTYALAAQHSAEDEETFKDRVPLIQMQRTTRARVR